MTKRKQEKISKPHEIKVNFQSWDEGDVTRKGTNYTIHNNKKCGGFDLGTIEIKEGAGLNKSTDFYVGNNSQDGFTLLQPIEGPARICQENDQIIIYINGIKAPNHEYLEYNNNLAGLNSNVDEN